MMRSRRLDYARFNRAIMPIIKEFFNIFNLLKIKVIPVKYQYNIDEIGVQEGDGINGLVLGDLGKIAVIKKISGSSC